MIRTTENSTDVTASEYNKSSKAEAISIAEALKYVLDDLTEDDFSRMMQRCPKFYDELNDFIESN